MVEPDLELANAYQKQSARDVKQARKTIASNTNIGNAHKVLANHHAYLASQDTDKDARERNAQMAILHSLKHRELTGELAAIPIFAWSDMHKILGKKIPTLEQLSHNKGAPQMQTFKSGIGKTLASEEVEAVSPAEIHGEGEVPKEEEKVIEKSSSLTLDVDGTKLELAAGSYTREGNIVTIPSMGLSFEVEKAAGISEEERMQKLIRLHNYHSRCSGRTSEPNVSQSLHRRAAHHFGKALLALHMGDVEAVKHHREEGMKHRNAAKHQDLA
jgi:hypothetical protein